MNDLIYQDPNLKNLKRQNIAGSNYPGIRTVGMEVILTNTGTNNWRLPNMDTLKGMLIVGLETYCAVGSAGGNPNIPQNMYGVPQSPISGATMWLYADMVNSSLLLNDLSNTALIDHQPCADFSPPLNYGIVRKFQGPIQNIVWSNSFLLFPKGYVISAANVAAYFIVHYIDPNSLK